MSFGSSPCAYRRCSENSTEKPWKGEACKPCRKPFTTNCARRSSRLIWLMTSGLRYFSTDAIADRRGSYRPVGAHDFLGGPCTQGGAALALCYRRLPLRGTSPLFYA